MERITKATLPQKAAAFEWLRAIATDENRTPAVRRLAAIAQDEWHRCRELADYSERRVDNRTCLCLSFPNACPVHRTHSTEGGPKP